jgi:putative alpha-1,2-mannosidase
MVIVVMKITVKPLLGMFLAALGFYPVTPGVPQYVFGSPLFEKVTMNLQNGNTFTINAKNNNYNNHYINSLKLNGANHNKTWIDYDDIQKGGNLNFSNEFCSKQRIWNF